MSIRFRKTTWTLIALTLLALLALGVMSTPWFRNALERRAIAEFEARTGARVEVRELRFTPLIFQVTLHGLVLHGTESEGEAPLFTAKTVIVRFSPFAFLRRRFLLRGLAWDGAEIHLRADREGRLNLPSPLAVAPGSGSLSEFTNLSIRRVSISHTTVFWNDRRIPLEILARDVALQLSLQQGGRYSGTLAAIIEKLGDSKWDVPRATLAGRFDFSSTEFAATSVSWRSAGLAAVAAVKFDNFPQTHGRLNFRATGEVGRITRIIGIQNIAGGNVTVEGNLVYERGAWSSSGKVFGRGLTVRAAQFNSGIVDASADYSADRTHIALVNLKISTLGGVIDGKSEVSLNESPPKFKVQANVRGLNLAKVVRTLPAGHILSTYFHPDANAQGTLIASWQGALDKLLARFDLQLVAPVSSPAGLTPVSGSATGALTLDGGFSLTLEKSAFETAHSSISAQGNLSAANSNLAVRFTSTDFEEWRQLAEYFAGTTEPISLSLESPANFSGTLSGRFSHPEVHGDIQAGAFTFRGAMWDKLEANIFATPDHAEISSAHLTRGSSEITADASGSLDRWQFVRQGAIHLAVRARRTPLAGLEAALGSSWAVTGLASGELNLDGEISNLTGSGSLLLEQGRIFGQSLDSLRFSLLVGGSNWSLKEISANKGEARITGRATLNPSQRTFMAELHGGGISPSTIDWLAAKSKNRMAPTCLQGIAAFDVEAHGTPEDFSLHAKWNIRELALEGATLGDFEGEVDWQGQNLNVLADAHGPGGTVRLSGKATSTGNWPFELSGDYTDLRADPWIRLLAGGAFNAQSEANGSFGVTGALRNFATVVVRSQIQKLQVNLGEFSWSNAQTIEITYSGQKLSASQFKMRGPSTDMNIKGGIRFGENVDLSATAHGEADANLLNIFDPALEAVGRFTLDLEASGNLQHPSVNGTVTVDNVSLSYPGLPLRMAGLQGQIALEGDRLEVSSLHGMSGQNSIDITGSATLSRTPRYDLRAQIRSARVEYPIQFTSLLSGALHLVGTSNNGVLSGDLTVSRMTVPENFSPLGWVAEMARQSATPPQTLASTNGSKIRLDVRVASDPEVRIDSPNLRLVAAVALTIRGTLASPVAFGNVHLESGQGTVRGDRYKLNRGEITLANPFRTQPVLDLEAQTRIENYDLTLTVTGPVERPRVAYRSDPPLPTGDILSLLALGYARQQEEMQAAGSQRSSTIGTSAFLSQALSSELTGRFQKLFGVSRVRINPNVLGPGSATGTRITVEQQLTHDITVTYVTNTAYSQERVIQFDWAVSDNVSLVGIRDQNGVFGMEIRFRRRFK